MKFDMHVKNIWNMKFRFSKLVSLQTSFEKNFVQKNKVID